MHSQPDIPMPLRLTLGVMIAPFAGALVGAIYMALPLVWANGDSALVVYPFLAIGCFSAYPIALLLGVPIHLWLIRRKFVSLTIYTLIGMGMGALLGGVMIMLGTLNLYGASFPLLSAMTGAALFWKIAVPRSLPSADRL